MNPSRKKICFVVSSVLTAKFFLRFHIEILSSKYDIYLVGNFSQQDIDSISYFKLRGIKSINIEREINIFKDLKSVKSLALYYREMKFDAIHSLAPKAGLISAISGRIVGIKNRTHIFTGQVWHTKKGIFRFILKMIDKIIVILNTQTLVDSQAQREYLIDEKIVSLKKSLVLGKGSISGVDMDRFEPNSKLKTKIRTDLKIQPNDVVFMFMGRINKDKGIYDLAHAFKMLLQEHKNIFLLIVGYDEGNCINDIKKIINSDDHVLYYGSTDKPEAVINAGDVFCLPSYREGFGTGIIEASSCKLAIICSDTYGLRDTIIDKRTGLRHQVANAGNLYEKMKFYLGHPDKINEFGNNGYEYVKANFSAETISNAWLDYYSKLFINN